MLRKHSIQMLETLKQYRHSEISITVHNSANLPALQVSYTDEAFSIINLETLQTETFEDMTDALQAIEFKTAKSPATV